MAKSLCAQLLILCVCLCTCVRVCTPGCCVRRCTHKYLCVDMSLCDV